MADWIVFDYDGTLTTHRSGWTLLHSLFGTEHVQAKRRHAYRSGNLSFEQWAELDVQDWVKRGATKADVERIADAVKLTTGTEHVLSEIKIGRNRWGVLSGGLIELTAQVRRFDPAFVRGNSLEFDDDGRLVGVEKCVGPAEKGEELEALGADYGFDPERITFVGDSRSDLEAFQTAGRAVLFDPAPSVGGEVFDATDVVIDGHDLTELLDAS